MVSILKSLLNQINESEGLVFIHRPSSQLMLLDTNKERSELEADISMDGLFLSTSFARLIDDSELLGLL